MINKILSKGTIRGVGIGDGDRWNCYRSLWAKICSDEGVANDRLTEIVATGTGTGTGTAQTLDRAENCLLVLYADIQTGRPRGRPNITRIRLKGGGDLRGVMRSVGRFAASLTSLTHLDLSRCCLSGEGLEEVVEVARRLKRITLDHNPLLATFANFHALLVHDSSVEELSLKCCSLGGSRGLRSLSRALVGNRTLKVLNLNFNSIDCPAAKLLAKGLKWNGGVVSLSMKGNRIGDRGARAVADALQVFPLDPEERAERRRTIVGYLMDRHRTIVAACGSSRRPVVGSEYITGVDSEPEENGRLPGYILSDPVSEYRVDEQIAKQVASRRADGGGANCGRTNIPGENHPLVTRVKDTVEGPVSKGNCSLVHLDLSYNRIGEEGVASVLAALTYQDLNNCRGLGRGLALVSLQGNKLENGHPLMLAVDETLSELNALHTTKGAKRRNSKIIVYNIQ